MAFQASPRRLTRTSPFFPDASTASLSRPVPCILEGNFAAQLPESGFVRGSGLSKISIREIHVDAAVCNASKAREVHVICAVKKIENLKPELKIYPLGNLRVLIEVHVRFDKVRPAELHSFLIPLRTESGLGEVALGNCPSEPRFVAGRLAVT